MRVANSLNYALQLKYELIIHNQEVLKYFSLSSHSAVISHRVIFYNLLTLSVNMSNLPLPSPNYLKIFWE